MRGAALAVLLLAASVSATPATFEDFQFRAPAQMGPTVEVAGATWILLTFPEGSAGQARLDLSDPVASEEFQENPNAA